jgi:hypothetical protein
MLLLVVSSVAEAGVVYSSAVRTARMQEVCDAINQGSGAGKIKIGTSGMGSVLATITMADPACTVSGDVLTIDADPDLTDLSADNSGTAATATITDSDDNVIVSGFTVSTSGANINLDSVNITAGQTVTITSGSLTHNTSGI